MPTIQKTEDGSDTLFSEVAGQTYHSQHGARTESEHIFITSGIEEFCKLNPTKNTIKILEIGFGTGLNALLTQQFAKKNNIKIEYHTIELYPIDKNIFSQLNYAQTDEEKEIFEHLHSANWIEYNDKESEKHCATEIKDNFLLYKYKADIIEQLNIFASTQETLFDVIYFDAFSPDAQPELWSQEIFNNTATTSNYGAIITTYCAKGDVRRAMITAGFETKKLAGPPGKRHILRGIKTKEEI